MHDDDDVLVNFYFYFFCIHRFEEDIDRFDSFFVEIFGKLEYLRDKYFLFFFFLLFGNIYLINEDIVEVYECVVEY